MLVFFDVLIEYSTHGLKSIHQRIICLFYTKEKRVVLRWILKNSSLKLWWILEWLIVVYSISALWIQCCTRQFRGEDGVGRGT